MRGKTGERENPAHLQELVDSAECFVGFRGPMLVLLT